MSTTHSTAAGARTDQLETIIAALNERDLFSNPDILDRAAEEIDCGAECECIIREYDTGSAMCLKSDNGDYCPNDLAETLRAIAKVARAALAKTGGAA